MAEQTVDQMLDAGAGCLQCFKDMLDIAKWLSLRGWPDWRDYVCRNYDNERGIDLASIRGDAVMLQQQATAARQAATDQSASRTSVQTAWPDNAGRAAVTTLNAHQKRSEPVATVLERTATAAAEVPGAVVAAVAAKIAALSEFTTKDFNIGWGSHLKMTVGGALTMGVATLDELNELRVRFENQLGADLVAFSSACAMASSTIQAAYATVPAAAKGIDASAFPAPSFGAITATTTETPTGPTTASPVTSGGGGGGGSGTPTTSSSSSTSPTSTSTSPTTTGRTTSPTSTSPTTTGTTTPPTTTGASTAPSSATPSAGTGAGAGTGSGTPSWLSQLLPKLAEQLGLADKSATGDKDADKSATADKDADKSATADKDADKDTKGEKVLGVDALGRTVTATLSPDGKTVEVIAKKPDGTLAEKATLTIGEDGELTPVDGTDGTGKDGTGKPGEVKPGEVKPGETKPGDAKPTTPNDAGTGGATPAAASPSGTGGGTGGGATPSATPGPGVPNVPSAQAAPSTPSNTGEQNPAPAQEPCPPGESADQDTGAEFAVSGS